MKKRVAIIGGGYAGMAAAVAASEAGHSVTVFETSRVLGGRARKVEIGELTVDNGQHILIGAYRDTLTMLQRVGINLDDALLRLPLTLNYPGFRLHAPPLPAPLHLVFALLTAQGLRWREKLAAIRFMQWLKRVNFRLQQDSTVCAMLDQHQQPDALRRYLWEPLCISALNTPAERASGQVFANVLRDSLAAERSASDLLIPRRDLSALFPEAAARQLVAQGHHVRMQTGVTQIRHEDGRFRLDADVDVDADPDTNYTHVIAAVAPHHLRRLLSTLPALAPLCAQIDALQSEPIVTCYLRYPAHVRLPQPMLGLTGGFSHWVFDRGQLDGHHGLLAIVISAHGKHSTLEREALAAAVHTELKILMPDLPTPLTHQVITEKRATFACTPGLVRPMAQTAIPGLLLAGDYIASDYPATLEGAIRSGLHAVELI